MRYLDKNVFVCPDCKRQLVVQGVSASVDGAIVNGELVCQCGKIFPIRNGLPNLTFPVDLPQSDLESKNWYDANADVYDENLPLTFRTFDEDEKSIRAAMIAKLELQPSHRVLEVGAGTGRDSVLIAQQLNADGELHLQDICQAILEKSYSKLERFEVPVIFHLGNACHLPFPDDYFDAAFHFGGLNTFSDIGGFLLEMNRVTKHGGKVVIGDESMPDWLRETEFGKILMNSNPHYRYSLPLKHLPVSCRNVRLEWIIGGVFYVIDYRVEAGEPYADFDFEIPGPRGGTHRTRYYGRLEGVSPEAIELARKAREASGKSMFTWLDETIKQAALKELGQHE